MNETQKQFLSNKVVKIANHIEKQSDEKKELVAGYSREIKESKKRMNCLAKAIQISNLEILAEVMDNIELDDIYKMGK